MVGGTSTSGAKGLQLESKLPTAQFRGKNLNYHRFSLSLASVYHKMFESIESSYCFSDTLEVWTVKTIS